MGQADLVVVLGRKLDYQVAYGSPAVFGDARFIRISDTAGELIDNRRGQPELLCDVALALDAITEALGNDSGDRDQGWLDGLRAKQKERTPRARSQRHRRPALTARYIHWPFLMPSGKRPTRITSPLPMAATF